MAWLPLQCSTVDQWERWQEIALLTDVRPLGDGREFCLDCTPDYAEQMRAVGRCEHPDTVFRVDGWGFLEGIGPARYARWLRHMEGKSEVTEDRAIEDDAAAMGDAP